MDTIEFYFYLLFVFYSYDNDFCEHSESSVLCFMANLRKFNSHVAPARHNCDLVFWEPDVRRHEKRSDM